MSDAVAKLQELIDGSENIVFLAVQGCLQRAGFRISAV